MVPPSVWVFLILSLLVRGDIRLSSRLVSTKYGTLRGVILGQPSIGFDSVEVFLGIPYASPPTGDLRFMPPVSPLPWPGIIIADSLSRGTGLALGYSKATGTAFGNQDAWSFNSADILGTKNVECSGKKFPIKLVTSPLSSETPARARPQTIECSE
ncbi:unnamed protein product [Cyprideis torosa]|uniref:Uncharacterized protein n=1 Tax=Cyprideis torosa TaxID=163714 RepID=A0A7R8WCD4_9CRUS|nr:unnamed protein product [Cyprideis torosa]CAG0891939.1 unnamed protein product [Cyprideis torosa]